MRTRVTAVIIGLVLVLGAAACEPESPFFESTTRISVSGGFRPFVGDFDGDGWDDIWWFHEEGQDRLWEGRANGAFAHTVAPLQVDGLVDPVAGDFGGDAADDVLFASAIEDALGQLVILQVGGTVASSRSIDTPTNTEAFTIDDGGSYDAVGFRGYEAGGTGVWDPDKGSDAISWVSQPDDETPVSGDFDGDGSGDIFLVGWAPARPDRVAWGDGAGGFTVQTVRNVTGLYSVTAFDGDGDGRDDLAFTTDPVGETKPAMNLWFGLADRTFRRESREPFAGRGAVYAHRSHVGGGDTLVKYWHGGAESWAIDAEGVTRVGRAGDYPGPWHLTPLIGRFHAGVADDVVRYDEENTYAESYLRTPDAGVPA